MKVIASLLLAGLLAFGAISAARAQDGGRERGGGGGGGYANGSSIPEPLILRVGVVWPDSSQTRDWAGYSPVYGGIDYAIGSTGTVGASISSLYVDYWGGTGDGHFSTFGLGISDRVYATPTAGTPGQMGQVYYTGIGFGAYQISSSNGDGTVAGLKLFGGVEFSQKFILQLGYNAVPAKNGANPSGFNLQLGLRM